MSKRPNLPHLTFLLTEHCNLSCKRCGHFSPLADPVFAEQDAYARDLARLGELFGNVGNFWLMGGEPLLHPEPEGFLEVTRAAFPLAEICLTTNGTLLKQVASRFWEACRATRTSIEISAYPPFRSRLPEWVSFCEENHVQVRVKQVTSFVAWMNPRGTSDPEMSFRQCKQLENSVPLLRSSRLHLCSVSATSIHLNKKFAAGIPEPKGIDIFDPSLSGEAVLAVLSQSAPACRYCAHQYVERPWEQGAPEIEDWTGNTSSARSG